MSRRVVKGWIIEDTEIPEVKAITPPVFEDERGAFFESWSRPALAEAGLMLDFVQDNQAYSKTAGVVRGLHFQRPPFAQGKLLRVVAGEVLDVAVDIRKGSPSHGRHVARVLSAANRVQLWVPEGFAHGYLTRAPDTIVLYKATGPYSKAHEGGLLWNDPALGIDWGIPQADAVLKDADRTHPRLAELESGFTHS